MSDATSCRPPVRRLRSRLVVAAVLPAVLLLAASGVVAQDARRAEFYLHKGIKAMESGELGEARDAFLRARTLSSTNPMPEIYLGHVAMQRGEFATAEESYLHAIDLVRALHGAEQRAALHRAAEDAEALDRFILSSSHGVGGTGGPLALQQELTERQKREGTTQGLGFGLKALEAEDGVPADLYMYLGNARLEGGRPTEAAEAYQGAVQRAPDAPEPYHNLAVALAQAGRLSEAAEACAKAEAMGYEPAVALHRQIRQFLAQRDAAAVEGTP